MLNRRLRAVALMGATGSGKSALALKLAQQFSTTIIACDSMQLYRGLDVGTAKPSRQEQQRVSHALIDKITLPASADAVWWAQQVRLVIAGCNRQGETPLIVGGTGMYLRALLQGFAEIPPEKEAVRQRIVQRQQQYGTPYLHRMLCHVDASLASRLAPHDSQRIVRALAVAFSSGKTLSYWQQQQPVVAEISCPVFVLEMERCDLYPRVEQRFHAMIARNWLQEVRWLRQQQLEAGHAAICAVGYRQLLQHLDGALSLDAAIEAGIIATRHYAKRQQTWFRHQCANATCGDATALHSAITFYLNNIAG